MHIYSINLSHLKTWVFWLMICNNAWSGVCILCILSKLFNVQIGSLDIKSSKRNWLISRNLPLFIDKSKQCCVRDQWQTRVGTWSIIYLYTRWSHTHYVCIRTCILPSHDTPLLSLHLTVMLILLSLLSGLENSNTFEL